MLFRGRFDSPGWALASGLRLEGLGLKGFEVRKAERSLQCTVSA